jgi:formate hydrogenlyase subunit 3/multisubunit Na+/H+ antiporter MnhD subunit
MPPYILAILSSAGLCVAAALVAFALPRRAAGPVAAAGAMAAGVAGITACLMGLARHSRETVTAPWDTGLGSSLALGVDTLTLFFLLPVFALTAVAALYGLGYLGKPDAGGGTRGAWLSTNLLTASMVVILLARNGVLFLVAWEAMTLSSYFLVVRDHPVESARRAGVVYLVASQVGTAALLAMFLLLGAGGSGPGSLDFARLGPASAGVANAVFVLATIGFGTKAGFVPLHMWLPEAHPAAPSHISALMSGVMIKTGIYGLIRVLGILGSPRLVWGWTILVVGVVTALLGILLALAQHDLKRLLAYSSVENAGIIAMALGLGILGSAYGRPVVSVLGWAGALVHVLNHGAFKGLLFLGAGSVLHATGAREIDSMGGLAGPMPWTAGTFVVGALAASGLPPLGGFVSEFLVFSGALVSATDNRLGLVAVAAVVIVGLGLVGALAAACFVKALGIVFLGEPRSPEAARAHEAPMSMLVPLVVLALACVALGLMGPLLAGAVAPLAVELAALPAGAALGATAGLDALRGITAGAAAVLGIAAVLGVVRFSLLRRRNVRSGLTWDCGYAAPTARMQYTASSFAQPILDMFRTVLRPHRKLPEQDGLFPTEEGLATETHDLVAHRVVRPVLSRAARLLVPLRRLQHGNLHLYVLYIVLALVVLSVWAMQ